MRKSAKTVFTVAGLGVLGVSYAIGATAQVPQSFGANSALTNAGAALGSNSQASSSSSGGPSANTAISSSSQASTASTDNTATSGTSGGSSKPVNSATSAPAASASASAPAVQPSATPTKSSSASASASKTGAAINYRYGTVQLNVVKTDGAITAINLVQAGATGGREQAFPYLVKAAIAAQGASIANLSGATFTTQAFEQALTSALGKF